MFYRIRQFFQALFSKPSPSELEELQTFLPPQAYSLFLRQSLAEQRHGIDVAKLIRGWDLSLTRQEKINIVTAAILHDCGKSYIKIRLWHRVFIVLIDRVPRPLKLMVIKYKPFQVPLHLSTQHARWGSHLAKKAGLSMDVCNLIYEHHHPKTALGIILQKADNAC